MDNFIYNLYDLKKMAYQWIIEKTPEKLYADALTYLEKGDAVNYKMHLIMAANYGHSEAKERITDITVDQILVPFVEATSDYSYSGCYMGYLYRDGIWVEKNYVKARQFFETVAEKDKTCGLAFNDLGYIYAYGHGVQVDHDRAIKFYRTAANLGNPTAINNLGAAYRTGSGVQIDMQKARELFEEAGAKGFRNAAEHLEELFENTDLKDNLEEAIATSIKIKKYGLLSKFFGCSEKVAMLLCKMKADTDKVQLLESHIAAQPDGPLFLEIMEEWHKKLKNG